MYGAVAAALALLVLAAGAASADAPVVQAVRIPGAEAPRIDGELDDAAWRTATWFGEFRQSVPDFGAPPREPTRVAFLFDEHNVYVGVRCDDSAPELIRARKLRHRDEPETDDHIELVFDTYRDQIRGTVFVVNPLGAKEEGLINGYQRYTWNWNEVWEARARITETGWQTELRIPLRVLHYDSGFEQTWGVNVKRVERSLQ